MNSLLTAIEAKRIRHQAGKYRGRFLFPGANQDAIATAGRMNIQAIHTANSALNGPSSAAAKAALSRKMSAFRRRSQGDANAATVRAAERPLEARDEEEERGGDP